MFFRRSLTLSIAALLTMFLAANVSAQMKIATIDPARAFNDIEETKDLKKTMEAQRRAITDEEKRLVDDVEEAKRQVRLFNPGTKEYDEKNRVLIQKAIGLQTWRQLTQADLQRQQKDSMKRLFTKIEKAVKEIAEAKKLDIVIVDQRPDLPDDLDQINVDQLRALINQRTLIFNNNSASHDITGEVISKLNADYTKKP